MCLRLVTRLDEAWAREPRADGATGGVAGAWPTPHAGGECKGGVPCVPVLRASQELCGDGSLMVVVATPLALYVLRGPQGCSTLDTLMAAYSHVRGPWERTDNHSGSCGLCGCHAHLFRSFPPGLRRVVWHRGGVAWRARRCPCCRRWRQSSPRRKCACRTASCSSTARLTPPTDRTSPSGAPACVRAVRLCTSRSRNEPFARGKQPGPAEPSHWGRVRLLRGPRGQ